MGQAAELHCGCGHQRVCGCDTTLHGILGQGERASLQKVQAGRGGVIFVQYALSQCHF